ncbi:MAG: DUF3300 domain-containing protein [Candidatus Bruticola sp.]
MVFAQRNSRKTLLSLIACLIISVWLPWAAQASSYSNQELDKILAPIALYPDSLLGNVLAASTYPDQLIEADSWASQHHYDKASDTLNSVANKTWDESIKSLLLTPEVIAMMVNDLTWTDKLAQAFTTQQTELCNSVQRLRRQAKSNGVLETNDQVKVVEQNNVISIGSAQSDIIAVPQYSTLVCTQTFDPLDTFLKTALVWGTVRTLDAVFFGSYWDWHAHNIYIGPGYNHFYWNGAPTAWYPHPPVPPPPPHRDPHHPAPAPYVPRMHPSHNPPPPHYISKQKLYQDRRPGQYYHDKKHPEPAPSATPNRPAIKGNPNYHSPAHINQNTHSKQTNANQDERPNFTNRHSSLPQADTKHTGDHKAPHNLNQDARQQVQHKQNQEARQQQHNLNQDAKQQVQQKQNQEARQQQHGLNQDARQQVQRKQSQEARQRRLQRPTQPSSSPNREPSTRLSRHKR